MREAHRSPSTANTGTPCHSASAVVAVPLVGSVSSAMSIAS